MLETAMTREEANKLASLVGYYSNFYLFLFISFWIVYLDRSIGKITSNANSELDSLTNDIENMASMEDFIKKPKSKKTSKKTEKKRKIEEPESPQPIKLARRFLLEEASGLLS